MGLIINWVTSGSTDWPIPPSGDHGANVSPSAPWSPHDGAKWAQVEGSSCTCTGHWTGFMGHQGLPLTQHTAHNGETDGSIILCQCNTPHRVGLYVRWRMEKLQFILCGVTALGSCALARGPDSRSWEMFGNVNNKAAPPPASSNNNYPATPPTLQCTGTPTILASPSIQQLRCWGQSWWKDEGNTLLWIVFKQWIIKCHIA